MYQRFSAAKDAASARKATIAMIVCVVIVELSIISSAWISSSLVPDAAAGKYILIYASYKFLPPLLAAIMLTTLVGCIISTADSYLLVPATCLIRDVYINYINRRANEKHIVLASRLAVLMLGLIAYWVSRGFAQSPGFFERSLYAYTIYGAAITPSLFAAFTWKGATKHGAIASITSGTAMTLLWKESGIFELYLPAHLYNGVDEVLPAFLVSSLSLILVSKFYKQAPLKVY